MGIIQFLVICILCAGLYWVLDYLFHNAIVNKIAIVGIVILLTLLLLTALGLWPIGDVQFPKIR